jgi:hypothetical protein
MAIGGVRSGADAVERATGGLDLLGDRREVAVATDDDDGAQMIEAAEVLGRIEAQLDVRPIPGRGAR